MTSDQQEHAAARTSRFHKISQKFGSTTLIFLATHPLVTLKAENKKYIFTPYPLSPQIAKSKKHNYSLLNPDDHYLSIHLPSKMHGFRPSILISASTPILPTQKPFLPRSKPACPTPTPPQIHIPETEARLIQVRKSPSSGSPSSCDSPQNSDSDSPKRNKKPERGSISISQAKVQKMNEDLFGLLHDVTEFLMDVAGKGGVWEGW